MKRLLLILTATIGLTISGKSQITPTVNIPNNNFKTCLVNDTLINTNGDTEIQLTEANSFNGTINCQNAGGIPDYTGLEEFTNVNRIMVIPSSISYLDLTSNLMLQRLDATLGRLDSINIAGLNRLKVLNLTRNKLKFLDISSNDSINLLQLRDNELSSISVNNLTTLEYLDISDNPLISNIDVLGNDSLKFLNGFDLPLIDTIDVTGLSKLEVIQFSGGISELIATGANKVNFLNLSNSNIDSVNTSIFPDLEQIQLVNNQLTYLDISNNLKLEGIALANCGLDSIDLTPHSFLENLLISNNNINSLDLSSNFRLRSFRAENNNLDSIDLNGKNQLTSIRLSNNNISILDLSSLNRFSPLNTVLIDSNNLTTLNIQNGRNTLITDSTRFSTLGNPNLTCIQVDDSTYSANTWTNIDNQTSFDTNCNYITSLTEKEIENKLAIYPNPSTGIFNISNAENIQSLEVYGMNGQKLEDVSIQAQSIDLFNHPNGIYFVRMTVRNEVITRKIIKQ